jgi:hypothetical protein
VDGGIGPRPTRNTPAIEVRENATITRCASKWLTLPAFSLLFWTIPAVAQRRPTGIPAGGGQHPNLGAMKQQMQAQQQQLKQQMLFMKKQMQAHQQHEQAQQKQMQKQAQIAKKALQKKQAQQAGTTPEEQGGAEGRPKRNASTASANSGGDGSTTTNGNAATGTKNSAKNKQESKSAAAKKHHEAEKKALSEKKAVHKGVQPQDQASVSALHAVRTHLQSADHDYDGHRVRAIHHLTSALHHLGSTSAGGGGGGQGTGGLSQQASDAILQEARTSLHSIHAQLSSKTATGAHHGSARGAVSNAIRELDTALRIR